MKDLQQVKEEVAVEKGFDSWEELLKWGERLLPGQLDSIYDTVSRRFGSKDTYTDRLLTLTEVEAEFIINTLVEDDPSKLHEIDVALRQSILNKLSK